jgi:hypothetical protein
MNAGAMVHIGAYLEVMTMCFYMHLHQILLRGQMLIIKLGELVMVRRIMATGIGLTMGKTQPLIISIILHQLEHGLRQALPLAMEDVLGIMMGIGVTCMDRLLVRI